MVETLVGTLIYGTIFYIAFRGKLFDAGGFNDS